MGGKESQDIIEGVYLTLCLRRVESCKFIIVVSNMVNGRCPGCDYIKSREGLVSIDCILLDMINYAI